MYQILQRLDVIERSLSQYVAYRGSKPEEDLLSLNLYDPLCRADFNLIKSDMIACAKQWVWTKFKDHMKECIRNSKTTSDHGDIIKTYLINNLDGDGIHHMFTYYTVRNIEKEFNDISLRYGDAKYSADIIEKLEAGIRGFRLCPHKIDVNCSEIFECTYSQFVDKIIDHAKALGIPDPPKKIEKPKFYYKEFSDLTHVFLWFNKEDESWWQQLFSHVELQIGIKWTVSSNLYDVVMKDVTAYLNDMGTLYPLCDMTDSPEKRNFMPLQYWS